MFNPDFYPTPQDVIFSMLEGINITDKIILEPSAGKGDIIDYLTNFGAREVLFCEIEKDLQAISQHKGKFLCADFLELTSAEISHIDLIVMNPPFSADTKHILHAFDIAPAGSKIIALCNAQTILNPYSQSRKELSKNIELYGSFKNLGSCFLGSERSTGVEVGLIVLQKAGANYSTEFEGFFLDDEEEPQGDGIMSYNVVRDLVNRYVESIKIFDRQLEEANKMNNLTSGYFSVKMGMSITDDNKPIQRAEFKKEMQKSGWHFIFNKMNMQKYATSQLRADINKFVEEQTEVPFNMRNIYKMLELVVGTTGQRMDKAIEVVFDKVTMHHHENRFGVKGWKTNENYVLTQKFIVPNICYQDQRWYKGQSKIQMDYNSNREFIEDMLKAICYITGDNYDNFTSLRETAQYQINEYGKWFDWAYFRVKCFKVGTAHFEFKDREIWARFNQRVAQIKGFPLYEKAPDKRTDRQKAKAKGTSQRATAEAPIKQKPTILGTYKIKV
jgi:predicted RNA methylase